MSEPKEGSTRPEGRPPEEEASPSAGGTEAPGVGTPPLWRETIWSPWRMEYIESEKPDGCVFCEAGRADPAGDEERYVLFRGKHHYIVLNLWPYNNGHAMIVPYDHVEDITELSDESALEMFHLSQRLVAAYRRAMRAQGVNVGLNLGRVSGGSIDHLHLHLVPRWMGDANFMPVIGHTKVLVEMLRETWARLRAEIERWPAEGPGA